MEEGEAVGEGAPGMPPGAWAPEGAPHAPPPPPPLPSYDDLLRSAMEEGEAVGEGAPDPLAAAWQRDGLAREPDPPTAAWRHGGVHSPSLSMSADYLRVAPAAPWPPRSDLYTRQSSLPHLGYPLQVTKDAQTSVLTNLAQSEELPEQKILQTDAPEALERRAWAGLEARVAELEKKAASVAAPAPKRATKRRRPRARKRRNGRSALQGVGHIHNSGTPCTQFVQNSSIAFLEPCPGACNNHGWNGVTHTTYTDTSSPGMLTQNRARRKFSINGAGRSCISAAQSALLWTSENGVMSLLLEFLRWAVIHFQGTIS